MSKLSCCSGIYKKVVEFAIGSERSAVKFNNLVEFYNLTNWISLRNWYLQVPRNGNQQSGKLNNHAVELNRKCEVTKRKSSAIEAKHQVGKEENRVKLKLDDFCF